MIAQSSNPVRVLISPLACAYQVPARRQPEDSIDAPIIGGKIILRHQRERIERALLSIRIEEDQCDHLSGYGLPIGVGDSAGYDAAANKSEINPLYCFSFGQRNGLA